MGIKVKVFLTFAIICICSAWGRWNTACAENEEPVVIEGIAASGILVLEHDRNEGTLEVVYGGERTMVSCDYSELEVPMDQTCILVVHPHAGFEIENVLANGESLKGQDEVYYIYMAEEFMAVDVNYKKTAVQNNYSDNRTESTLEMVQGASKDYTKAEGPARIQRNPAGSNSGNSVSAISYDVKVIYLDGRDNPANGEPIVEEVEHSDSDQDEAVDGKTTVVGKDNNPVTFKEKNQEELSKEHTENVKKGLIPKNENADREIESQIQSIISSSSGFESKDQRFLSQNDNYPKDQYRLGQIVTVKENGSLEEISEVFNEREKTTQTIKTKSVQIISILPLYLFLSCCMIVVRLVVRLS